MFCDAGTAMPQVQGQRVRALAATSLKRTSALADLPTVAESGVAGFEMIAWTAVFVPTGTPEPVITRLNQSVVTVLNSPEVRQRMSATSELTPSTPRELGDFVLREIDKWKRVVAQARLEVE